MRFIRRILQVGVVLLVGLLVVASIVPALRSDYWVVRMASFPRLQVLILLGVAVVLAVLLLRRHPVVLAVLIVFSGAAAISHAVVLWPYRPAHGTLLGQCDEQSRVSVIVANVEAGNRRAKPLLELVGRISPDLFLAMETDAWWNQALQPLGDFMPHTLSQVQEGYFGIHLFSKLPLSDTEIRFLAGQDTPSLFADLQLRDGTRLRFVGMHPRPPQPFQSSAGRDAQLFAAGLALRDEDGAYVVAGDLNATPWENAIKRLKRVARLVDPRYGFGYVATYSTRSWWQRWPIDQVLHSRELVPLRVERLTDIGSDHFPYLVELCHGAEPIGAPPALEPGDLEAANTILETVVERTGQ